MCAEFDTLDAARVVDFLVTAANGVVSSWPMTRAGPPSGCFTAMRGADECRVPLGAHR